MLSDTHASLLLLALFVAPAAGSAQEDPPERPRMASESETEGPRGLILNAEGAFDGTTLFAPLSSTTTYLVDMDGEVLHEWPMNSSPAGGLYMLDDGTLLRCGREDDDPQFRGGGIGGRIQLVAPDGELLWDYRLANESTWQHHDVEPLPNGNVLVIAWERMSAEEAVSLGRDPEQVGDAGLWTDAILELRPVFPDSAEVVWKWRSRDHLVQDLDEKLPNHADIISRPGRIDVNGDHRDEPPKTAAQIAEERRLEEEMSALGYVGGYDEDEEADADEPERRRRVGGDWLHTNAVDYDAELDLIVLSTPHLSEVWVIDHSTTTAQAATEAGGRRGRGGAILWRWGNPRVHGAGGDEDRRLYYQHDPTWIRGADGDVRLMLFNNGRGRDDGDYSTVDELVLPFDDERGFENAAGAAHGPEDPAWSYEDREHFFSAFISGAQRLPNGNTLICSGVAGRLFEVTRDGRVVWDYRNPIEGGVESPEHAGNAPPLALFRGTRLARDHPGVQRVLEAR